MTMPPQAQPTPTGAMNWPSQTALEKLEWMQKNRRSLLQDIRENWVGWLFSLVFHLSVLGLSFLLVSETVQQAAEFTVETSVTDENPIKVSEAPLEEKDSAFESDVESDVDDAPSVISDSRNDLPTAGYSDLSPGAPDFLTVGGGMTGIGEGGGHGGDHLAGKDWGGHVRTLRKSGLEVVFVFDSTGSMGGIILETRMRIRQLMSVVSYLVPDSRLGLVTYRDSKFYDTAEYEYTTKSKPLTTDIKDLEKWLNGIEAYGGGDAPEDVYDGLDAAMNLNWGQGTKKVIIVFGDQPPHPENDGLNKVYEMCKKWRDKTGGQISCIDTSSDSAKVIQEFKDMAAAGGGDATLLKNERDIIRQLCVYIFGAKYEKEVVNVFNNVLKGPSADVKIVE